MIVVLAVLAMVAVVGVLALVVTLGLVVGGSMLAVKLAPLLLVAWIAMRVLRGRRYGRGHALAPPRQSGYAYPRTLTEDDAWLDTRG